MAEVTALDTETSTGSLKNRENFPEVNGFEPQDYASPSDFVSSVSRNFTSEINCGKLDLFLSAKYSDEERFIGDTPKIQKILEELITKSIKLTGEKGAVACAMYRKPKRDRNRRVVDLKGGNGEKTGEEFVIDYILCADIRIAEDSVAQQIWVDFYRLFEQDMKEWNERLKDNPHGGIKFQRRQGEMGKVAVFSLSIPLHIVDLPSVIDRIEARKQSQTRSGTVSRSRSASGVDASALLINSHGGQQNKCLVQDQNTTSTTTPNLAPISENSLLAGNDASPSSPRQFNVSNWISGAANSILFNASNEQGGGNSILSAGNNSSSAAAVVRGGGGDDKQSAAPAAGISTSAAVAGVGGGANATVLSPKASQVPPIIDADDRRSSRAGSREPSTHSGAGGEDSKPGFLRRLLMLKTFTSAKPDSSHIANDASSMGVSGVRNFSSSAPDLEQALENAMLDDDPNQDQQQELDSDGIQQARLRAASFSGTLTSADSSGRNRKPPFTIGKSSSIAPAPLGGVGENRRGTGGQSPRHSAAVTPQQSPPDSTRTKSTFPFSNAGLPRPASFSNSVVPISDAMMAAASNSAAATTANAGATSLPTSPTDSTRRLASNLKKTKSARSLGLENVRNALSNRSLKSILDGGGAGENNGADGGGDPSSCSRRPSSVGQPRVRFMVVDDHVDDRAHARDVLVADGQSVTDALDVIDCVRIMKEAAASNEYYEVILLDYDMPPFMWGDKAANLLRKEGYDGLIIGLVDEEATEKVIRRFLTNGGDAVIPKPLQLDTLREELSSLQL